MTLLPVLSFVRFATTHAAAFSLAWKELVPVLSRSLIFTMLQALASTALALVIGMPGAWLAAKYRFPFRNALLALAAVPFCMPPMLVVLAFVLYFGRQGWFTTLLSLVMGGDRSYRGSLYSFGGLVMVHAFYNFPIVVQQVGALWARIPQGAKEAARTLGAKRWQAFLTGTLPWLAPGMFQAAGLIFLYCFFSFTTVLVFGGTSGSTLEVEIFRSLRYAGRPMQALVFAILETGGALSAIAIISRLGAHGDKAVKDFGRRPPLAQPRGFVIGILLLYAAGLAFFFFGPLLAVAVEAFRVPSSLGGRMQFGPGNFIRLIRGFQAPLLPALAMTLRVSGSAAVAATVLGVAAALAVRQGPGTGTDLQEHGLLHRMPVSAVRFLMWLPLAVSPAVFAYGWAFLSSHLAGNESTGGMQLALAAAQAMMAWPFVARGVSAALASIDRSTREAARTLGARPLQAFLTVELRAIAPSVAASAAFAFSITAGDVNVPLMLGMGEFETLPLLLYRLTSAYRFNEACAAGLVLAVLTGFVFFLKEKYLDVSLG